jgi:hypothetical protein
MGATYPLPSSRAMTIGSQNLEPHRGREPLEHGDVSTTMTYTDVLNRPGGRGVGNPLERPCRLVARPGGRRSSPELMPGPTQPNAHGPDEPPAHNQTAAERLGQGRGTRKICQTPLLAQRPPFSLRQPNER